MNVLQTIAQSALNRNHPILPHYRRQRIADRFRLLWVPRECRWFPELDCVTTESGDTELEAECERIDRRWYHREDLCGCDHCGSSAPINSFRPVFTWRPSGTQQTVDWCEGCVEEDSVSCDNCGACISAETCCATDEGYYCRGCEPEPEDRLPAWHRASRPYIQHGEEREDFWSLELEFESIREESRFPIINEIKELNNPQIIWEKDGSLSDCHGAEVIFCLYKSKDELFDDVSAVQAIIKKHGAYAWSLKEKRDRWAGIHISRNRNRWNIHQLMRLMYIQEKCKSELIRLAGRNCDYYAGFSTSILMGSRRRLREIANGYQGKYAAINLSSGGRIEWRMFNSTLNASRLLAYLNTIDEIEKIVLSKMSAHGIVSACRKVIINQINSIK